MFQYNSVQTHSEFKNGKGHTKTRRVKITGKSGFKSITIRNKSGRVTRRSKKRLTQKEITCIKRCEFVPGLFKDCQKCLK
jgi:hypothetical protein